MTLLIDVISNMGISAIQESFLGSDLTKFLQLLDEDSIRPKSLAKLVHQRFGEVNLLIQEKKFRNEIFSALEESEARELLGVLGIEDLEDPWNKLISLTKRIVEENQLAILKHFGYPNPVFEEQVEFKEATVSVKPEYVLFPHQIDASKKAWDFLHEFPKPRALLHMPTGSGKTRTAMNVICKFLRDQTSNQVVIWLANGKELCSQAAGEFEKAWKFLGNRELDVHRRFDSNSSEPIDVIKDGFLVAGVGLLSDRILSAQEEFNELRKRTSLVIFDEAHQTLAPTYERVLRRFGVNDEVGILGLTATPGRSTLNPAEDLRLAEFYKKNKVDLRIPGYEDRPVQFLIDEGYLANPIFDYIEWAHPNFTLSPKDLENFESGNDFTAASLKTIGQVDRRNLMIIDRIQQEVANGRKIILFACSVEHSELLDGALNSLGIISASITQNTSSVSRARAFEDFRNRDGSTSVLCNFGVLATGFDAPAADCAFIARPTNSVLLYNQMIGRVARGLEADGNKDCHVITVKDLIPGFDSLEAGFEFFDPIWIEEEPENDNS